MPLPCQIFNSHASDEVAVMALEDESAVAYLFEREVKVRASVHRQHAVRVAHIGNRLSK